MRLPPIPLDDGEIRGSIVDAQAGLNVNALGSVGTQSVIERGRIERLIARRGGPAAALDAIADWIDVDTIARERGAEDAYYLAQRMPALAANADVMRIAELAQVRGVTPAALAAIAPFVTALPAGTPVNLNTAPPEVLAAIVDNLDGDALAGLVVSRAGKPYSTIAEFRARLPNGAKLPGEEALAVRSDYFLVTIEARQGATLARARALVKRSGSTWPAIVWEVVE
jgi:general secretion pathway protein K